MDWKLELARRITRAGMGRRAPRPVRTISRGSSAGRGAGGGAGSGAPRGRSRAFAEAARRGSLGVASTSEARRLIEAGRGQAERRAVRRSTCRARARRRAPAGRQAPFRPVDTVGRPAILLRPSERTAWTGPETRDLGASRPDSYPIRFDFTEASGASRRLFCAVRRTRHRSLKTQQRTFFECRDLVQRCREAGEQLSIPRRPPSSTHGGWPLSNKLEVKGLPAFRSPATISSRRV